MTMQNLRSGYRANRAQNELLSAFSLLNMRENGIACCNAEVQMNTHQKQNEMKNGFIMKNKTSWQM